MKQRLPWDCSCRMSERGLAGVLRGLVAVGGTLTDSYAETGAGYKPGHQWAQFRVHIPEGQEAEFERVAGVRLSEPPLPDLPGTRFG